MSGWVLLLLLSGFRFDEVVSLSLSLAVSEVSVDPSSLVWCRHLIPFVNVVESVVSNWSGLGLDQYAMVNVLEECK